MLSNKWTFSLASFVMVIAFGLVIYAPSVMADGATHDFGVTISPAENMIDVVAGGGMEIASGRNRSATRTITPGTTVSLLITTNEIVHLARPGATLEERDGPLDITDLIIDAYDAEGRSLGILELTEDTIDENNVTVMGIASISHRDPLNPGKEFLVTIDAEALQNAYTIQRGGGQTLEIHTLLFSIAKGALDQADIAYVTAVRGGHVDNHKNALVAVYRVDLVDEDQGDPAYHIGVSDRAVAATGDPLDGTDTNRGSGTPGVVAIQTLRERAGFIESGPFDVRVILTEEPVGGLTTDLIDVVNGSATKVTKGQTLKGLYAAVTDEGRKIKRVN